VRCRLEVVGYESREDEGKEAVDARECGEDWVEHLGYVNIINNKRKEGMGLTALEVWLKM